VPGVEDRRPGGFPRSLRAERFLNRAAAEPRQGIAPAGGRSRADEDAPIPYNKECSPHVTTRSARCCGVDSGPDPRRLCACLRLICERWVSEAIPPSVGPYAISSPACLTFAGQLGRESTAKGLSAARLLFVRRCTDVRIEIVNDSE
jgi:hypothetical protein